MERYGYFNITEKTFEFNKQLQQQRKSYSIYDSFEYYYVHAFLGCADSKDPAKRHGMGFTQIMYFKERKN